MVVYRNRISRAYGRRRSVKGMAVVTVLLVLTVGLVLAGWGAVQRLDAEDEARFAALARVQVVDQDVEAARLMGWNR